MYVFDEMPMFLALIVFNIYHPGRLLSGPSSEFPGRKERNGLKAQAREERVSKSRFWARGKRDGGAGRDGYVLSYREMARDLDWRDWDIRCDRQDVDWRWIVMIRREYSAGSLCPLKLHSLTSI
jgi:hypothetical protein